MNDYQCHQHPRPETEFHKIGQYSIGLTQIHIVRQTFNRDTFNTYLVERNGIYFHMTGPELEASTGAVAY